MEECFLENLMAILGRTPVVLDALLQDLPEGWTEATEGPGTWSPYAVMGHLIHGEVADWMPPLEMILEFGPSRTSAPFDREAQFQESRKKRLGDLLDEFGALRGMGCSGWRRWIGSRSSWR